MTCNYDIILIEDFDVDSDGNLIITAIIENMGECTVKQSFWDPPEFAPARCKTRVYPEYLPGNMQFKGKSKEELEELVNRFNLLSNQEWEYVINDDDYDYNADDYSPNGSRLYF